MLFEAAMEKKRATEKKKTKNKGKEREKGKTEEVESRGVCCKREGREREREIEYKER